MEIAHLTQFCAINASVSQKSKRQNSGTRRDRPDRNPEKENDAMTFTNLHLMSIRAPTDACAYGAD